MAVGILALSCDPGLPILNSLMNLLTCGPLIDHFQARINHFQATSLNGPMSQTLNALEQSKMDCSVDSALPPSTLPSAPLPFPLKDFKEERVSRVLTKVTPLP